MCASNPFGDATSFQHPRRSEIRSRLALACAAVVFALLPAAAAAYTAAGDRIFPATILLPQPAPTDSLYVTPSTRPVAGANATNLTVTLDKTLTERLGIGFQDGYNWIGRRGASTLDGWQNLFAYVKYEAIQRIGVGEDGGGLLKRDDLVPDAVFCQGTRRLADRLSPATRLARLHYVSIIIACHAR